MKQSVYTHKVKRIDGKETSMSEFEGRVLLIVNVASKCGLTPQYEALEKLYEQYHERGFEILGFPSNEFMGQEPGSNEEIAKFCEMKFGVKFPMFEKISVNGSERNALYTDLIKAQPSRVKNTEGKLEASLASHGVGPKNETDIMWNFEKFLVDRSGSVVARFAPDLAPDDPKIVSAISSALAAKT